MGPDKLLTTHKADLIKKLSQDRTYPDSPDVWRGVLDTLPSGFIEADPSHNFTYLEWIVKSYLAGGIARYEDLVSRVRPTLEYFVLLRNKLPTGDASQPHTNMRNIINYCGLRGCQRKKFEVPGLETYLQPFIERYEKQHAEAAAAGAGTADKIFYQDRDITIYNPKTKEESCHYGRGTRWCTAATKGGNMFDSYNERGPLYIIVPKKAEHKGEKYQFHVASESYMDETDASVSVSRLVERWPGLLIALPALEYKCLREDIFTRDIEDPTFLNAVERAGAFPDRLINDLGMMIDEIADNVYKHKGDVSIRKRCGQAINILVRGVLAAGKSIDIDHLESPDYDDLSDEDRFRRGQQDWPPIKSTIYGYLEDPALWAGIYEVINANKQNPDALSRDCATLILFCGDDSYELISSLLDAESVEYTIEQIPYVSDEMLSRSMVDIRPEWTKLKSLFPNMSLPLALHNVSYNLSIDPLSEQGMTGSIWLYMNEVRNVKGESEQSDAIMDSLNLYHRRHYGPVRFPESTVMALTTLTFEYALELGIAVKHIIEKLPLEELIEYDPAFWGPYMEAVQAKRGDKGKKGKKGKGKGKKGKGAPDKNGMA